MALGCCMFKERAERNGEGASPMILVKNISRIAIETPTRAYNLDKADKEYKGRQYTKAWQGALGEEVRQKIASMRRRKEQGEWANGARPSQEMGLQENDCKRGVPPDNNEARKQEKAHIGHREESALKKTIGSFSAQKKRSQESGLGSRSSKSADSSLSALSAKTGVAVPESSEMSWGHPYSLSELEAATNDFSDANVLGDGNHGTVFRGLVSNGTHIAVKSLSNNRGQAEREFKSEVEAIGRIRHKNLVRLIGYCTEGPQRILVYEYIGNGNLDQWLHGPLGKNSPLSWNMRVKSIIGTAKGLAYLHEGLEPKVVHRDVKPSNILLDSEWNAKVSDFGLAKLVGTGNGHVTTRVMGTFGYVAPEYVSTGMLTEKSDVYSYGVLVMELISGRVPFDRSRPAGEVHLVDWIKSMVGSRRSEDVADPSMDEKPSIKSLKRVLLVALRCVDPDASKRPKMSHVVHMLETADDTDCYQDTEVAKVYSCRRSGQLPTTQKHRLFAVPAFILSQKTYAVDKFGETSIYNALANGNGRFVGSIDRKSTGKYER